MSTHFFQRWCLGHAGTEVFIPDPKAGVHGLHSLLICVQSYAVQLQWNPVYTAGARWRGWRQQCHNHHEVWAEAFFWWNKNVVATILGHKSCHRWCVSVEKQTTVQWSCGHFEDKPPPAHLGIQELRYHDLSGWSRELGLLLERGRPAGQRHGSSVNGCRTRSWYGIESRHFLNQLYGVLNC